jgi:hypothetical protein
LKVDRRQRFPVEASRESSSQTEKAALGLSVMFLTENRETLLVFGPQFHHPYTFYSGISHLNIVHAIDFTHRTPSLLCREDDININYDSVTSKVLNAGSLPLMMENGSQNTKHYRKKHLNYDFESIRLTVCE